MQRALVDYPSPSRINEPDEVIAYIETDRGRFGGEPICRVLGVSACASYHRKIARRSARVVDDERMLGGVRMLTALTVPRSSTGDRKDGANVTPDRGRAELPGWKLGRERGGSRQRVVLP
jgi:hypothetical protein